MAAVDSSGRASRLKRLFHSVLDGKRSIDTSADARLFLEAIQAQESPQACVERIIAKSCAMEALKRSVTIDISLTFIESHTLKVVGYLNDPGVRSVANGQFFQQILVKLVDPSTLWDSLIRMASARNLKEESLLPFSWFCLELLSLPSDLGVDVFDDISGLLQEGVFLQASTPETRANSYKLQALIDFKLSSSTGRTSFAPGGRHDNDFADFRSIAIYPTADELLSTEQPYYVQAQEVFAAEMPDRVGMHLDNQFRMLREDMLGKQRKDWQLAAGNKKEKSATMVLGKLEVASVNIGYQSRGRKCSVGVYCGTGLETLDLKDKKSKRSYLDNNKHYLRDQTFGALCAGLELYGFAYVIRDLSLLLQSRPIVLLQFTEGQGLAKALAAFKQSNPQFIMLDAPIFAYEPVLKCLQEIRSLPLQERLLNPTSKEDTFQPVSRLYEAAKSISSSSKATPVEVFGTTKLDSIILDSSQKVSLVDALTEPVTIIQGPPGTGKTFIGALAVKTIYNLSSLKMLVITYKNHAVDQFLEDLLDIDVDSEDMVRLGSKCTPATSSLLLSNQRKRYYLTNEERTLVNKHKEEASDLGDKLKHAFNDYIMFFANYTDIMEYLEFEQNERRFYDAFLVPLDSQGWRRVGRRGREVTEDYLYDRWLNGEDPGVFKTYAYSSFADVWTMDRSSRESRIQRWTRTILQERIDRVQELASGFDSTQNILQGLFTRGKNECVRRKRIVGCTTTGAAKYIKLIQSFSPDVVLVEEAGEILESHVLAALTPSVKQLILIGDHKQLRPRVNNYALSVEKGSGFDLNRSLFERLILQGHKHTTLQMQHRMHPSISTLVREMTYPDLLDGPKTSERPTIRGLEDRVIFLDHDHMEGEVAGLADQRDPSIKASKSNAFEAEMVLRVVKYLCQQGYNTKDIVVLTPYLGQLLLLKGRLSSLENTDPWLSDLDSFDLLRAGVKTQAAAKVDKGRLRLSTVDNYQGEESNIVVACLTRSNKNGDIGFMAAPERLNVLISRARDCLIMIGNMDTFMSSRKGRDTWVPFLESLKTKEHLYDGLPIRCSKHPDKRAVLRDPSDFDKYSPEGGCEEPCGAILKCGQHRCHLQCHRIDDHSRFKCQSSIENVCKRQHKVQIRCHEKHSACPKCVSEDREAERITKELERKVKRDLKIEAKRKASLAEYARKLQEIQDEQDHQRRIIKYEREDEERKTTLDQNRKELEALKETAGRVQEQKKSAARRVPSSSSHSNSAQGPKMPPSTPDVIVPGSAREEWEYMKESEHARSDSLDQLMDMIGLEEVKKEFVSIKSKVDTAIRQHISVEKERFSCSLLGNPGTGKTTVARLYGKFLTSIGVIPGSVFKETTGSSLANGGISGCQKLLDDILNDGGGVLFIDEAYQLASRNNPGGGSVLDFLLPEVENLTGKVVFVLAGYNKQMEDFFAHNPGLPSRFPIEMKFADYTDDEMLRILQLKITSKYGGIMKCEDGLGGLYCRILSRRIGRGRGREGFGNARTVENQLSIISSRQADRLRKERRAKKKSDDLLFTKEDLIGPEPSGALANSNAWQKLQNLIGLGAVKQAVKSLVDSVQQNYLRELEEQPPIEYSLNRVFVGSPGTGKTTVAKLYGSILVDLGLLSKSEVILKNPSDFVGGALGQSEQQTKGILAAASGKVLVIDEAYGLYGGGGSQGATSDPYKTAVIDTIVAEVQSVPGDDRCVLLLGYRDQMENMFQNVNPGLSRRFPMSSAFEFEDFDNDDLKKILDSKLKQQRYQATDQAKQVALAMLDRARNRPNFGNGGEVDIILDTAKARHQSRYSRGEAKEASTLEAVDFDEDFDRADKADTNLRALFQGTVGCDAIVELLEGYQQTARALKSLDMDPKENIPFNFLFRGPPGTGKTTTAKKMGKVFYDMGFLAAAEVVECSATDLVGQYVGQTGPTVQKLLDKALGKVLFVDEAYRLADGHFAKEAMDELVDSTTKDRYHKKLIIILAGYTDDINRLMSTNSGLTSRFPEVIDFHGLTPEGCVKLLTNFLKGQKNSMGKKQVTLDMSCLEAPREAFLHRLTQLFSELGAQANWASARDVQTVAKAVFNKVIRLAKDGTGRNKLTIEEGAVEVELKSMLTERASRAKKNKTADELSKIMPLPPQPLSQNETPRPVLTTTTIKTASAGYDKPEEEDCSPPQVETHVKEPQRQGATRDAVRDAGVSDEVWEQLQKNKQAEEQREQEYQDLLKAQRTALEEERDEIVARLLKEEERRKREAEARKKLQARGVCPAGYNWIKEDAGYRCAGGSHFMSDSELQKM